MRVVLLGELSGTRDGQQWPPRGATVDLPEDEALLLCRQGMAKPEVAQPADETAVVQADEEVRALTTETGPARRTRKVG